MTTPAPTVPPELKALMRRVKLGRLLDTLPERLTLARHHDRDHHGDVADDAGEL